MVAESDRISGVVRFPLPSLDEQADVAEKHGIDTLLFCRDPCAVWHFFLNQDTGKWLVLAAIVGIAFIVGHAR